MKKLQPGGTIDAATFDKQLDEELRKFNLKSKDERKVRDALVSLRDHMSTPEGKKFSMDRVAQRYTISGEGAEKFTGSPDEVRSNWFTGKLKIKDDQDAMSVAATIYDNVINSTKNTSASGTTTGGSTPTTETPSGGVVRSWELSDYMLNKRYGTSDNYGHQRMKWTTDDLVKENTMTAAVEIADLYNQDLSKNPAGEDKELSAKIQAAKQAALNKDWGAFEKASHALGWNYSSLFLSDSEKNAHKQKTDAEAAAMQEKVELDNKTNAFNSYKQAGLNQQVADALYSSGYTQSAKSWSDDPNMDWLSGLIQQNKVSVWHNPETGKYIAIKDGKSWNSGVTDRFSKGFGYTWSHGQDGSLTFYNPSEIKQNAGFKPSADLFADYDNKGRELRHNLEGVKVYGYSSGEGNNYSRDIIGNRDMLSKLRVTQGDKTFWVARGKDNKYYKADGNPFDINITGYGDIALVTTATKDLFPNINYQNKSKWGSDKTRTALEELSRLRRNDGSFSDVGGTYDNHARHLAWALTNDPKVSQDAKLSGEIRDILTAYDNAKGSPVKAKLGTKIQKFQGGAAFQAKVEAARKAKKESAEQPKKPVRDLTGTIKGMSGLEKTLAAAEVAGDVAGFVPGAVGAGGATVSFLAGIARDAVNGDGKTDWGKHLMNLGFIGASAFGLGGTKAALKGLGVAAKATDKVIDVGKAVDKLDSVVKTANAAEKAGAITKAKKLESFEVFKNLSDDVKKVNNVLGDKTTKISRDAFEKLVRDSGRSANEVTSLMGSFDRVITASKVPLSVSGQITSHGINLGKSVGKSIINPPKWVGKTLQIGTAAGGASGALGVAQDMKGEDGKVSLSNIGNVKVDNFQRALMGAASAKHLGTDFLNTKALKRISPKSVSSLNKVKIGDTEYDIDPIKVNKWNPLKKKAAEAERTAKWKKQVADAKNAPLTAEETRQIEKLSDKDFKYSIEKGELDFDPNVIKGEPTAWNMYLHNRASKILNKNNYTIPVKNSTATSTEVKTEKPEIKPGRKSKKVVAQTPEQKLEKLNNRLKIQERNLAKDQEWLNLRTKRAKGYDSVAKRASNLEKLIKQTKRNISAKKFGGLILKAESGINTKKVFDSNKTYKINPTEQGKLPYSPIKTNGSDWRFDTKGEYTPTYLRAIGGLNDIWWNENKTKLNDLVKDKGVTLNTLADFKRLATDKLPGRIHDFTLNKDNLALPKSLVNTHFNPTSIDASKITFSKMSPSTIELGGTRVNGTDGVWSAIKKGFDTDQGKAALKNLPELGANIAAWATTNAANRKAATSQRQAIIDGMYTIPYLRHQYFRTSTPYTLLGEKQAGNIQAGARRIASNVADLDKSIAIQLSGNMQANEAKIKGQQADLEHVEKIRNAQDQSNMQVDQANTNTLGQNRAQVATAAKNLHLINSNETLQQATNNVNMIMAANKWRKDVGTETDRNKLFNLYNDPQYKTFMDNYVAHDESAIKLKENWEKNWKPKYSYSTKESDWNESPELAKWKARKEQLDKILKMYQDRYKIIGMSTSMGVSPGYLNLPNIPTSYAKGGSLAPGEYLEAVRLQTEGKRKDKELELFYKAIMHNNAMLQKALIKVFK